MLTMRSHWRSRIGGTAGGCSALRRAACCRRLVPVLGHRKEAALRDVGGVVYQDVEAAEFGERFLEQHFDRRRVIESVGRPMTRALDLPFSFSIACALRAGSRLATTTCAPSAKSSAEWRVADPAIAAGDDGDAVL